MFLSVTPNLFRPLSILRGSTAQTLPAPTWSVSRMVTLQLPVTGSSRPFFGGEGGKLPPPAWGLPYLTAKPPLHTPCWEQTEALLLCGAATNWSRQAHGHGGPTHRRDTYDAVGPRSSSLGLLPIPLPSQKSSTSSHYTSFSQDGLGGACPCNGDVNTLHLQRRE